jgi:peptide-methionine (S)-S-oxide reductase
MGFVAVTVGFAALGAYLGRELSGGTGLVLYIGAFACIVGLNIAARQGPRATRDRTPVRTGPPARPGGRPRHRPLRQRRPIRSLEASGATAAFVAACGAYGYRTRRDLSSWGRTLFWALLALIVFGIVAICVSIPNSNLISAIAGLGIFGAFTIFDFNRLRRANAESAVVIAAGISSTSSTSSCWRSTCSAASASEDRLRAGPPQTQNFGAKESAMSDNTDTAILAGGCFWGVQELLRHRDGVISTRVGYTGGQNDNPTYRHHPGHAEAVEIVFDPGRISYRDILEFFFQIHDPTTKDRQGNDFGSDYRSEIFYTSEEQRRVAEDTIADVDASGLWPGKVVTAVSEAVAFWEAEAEHQDYLQRYPHGYNCHFPRQGWKLPHRETAA